MGLNNHHVLISMFFYYIQILPGTLFNSCRKKFVSAPGRQIKPAHRNPGEDAGVLHSVILTLFLLSVFLFVLPGHLYSQEINFRQYATEGIVLTNESPHGGALSFGQILEGDGTISIQLTDPDIVIFSIEAEIDKDVFVTITPPNTLMLDADNKMDFTLQAAYSNKGSNNKSEAKIMNGTSIRFPVLARENQPPGPPPTPNHGDNTTPTAKAYLYIYGDLTVSNTEGGSLAPGMYTGTIDITVSYEKQNP